MDNHFHEIGGAVGEWLSDVTWRMWNWRSRDAYYAVIGEEQAEARQREREAEAAKCRCGGEIATCQPITQDRLSRCALCDKDEAHHYASCVDGGCETFKICYRCMEKQGVMEHMHKKDDGGVHRFDVYTSAKPATN
jgi:hypothetical protein